MRLPIFVFSVVFVLSCSRGTDNPADPTPPIGLKAVALNDSTIELTWLDSENEAGYKIERGIDGGPLQEVGSLSQNAIRFVDIGLQTDHRYRYRVKAFAANEKEACADTEINHVFPAPSDLVLIQVSESEVRLEWKDNSAFESGFRIERKEGVGGFSEIGIVGRDVHEYIDRTAVVGRKYTYRVSAFTITNQSQSAERIIDHTFDAPANLRAIPLSESKVKLDWSDRSSFEEGFAIERKRGISDFVEIARVPLSSTSVQSLKCLNSS